MTNQAERYRMVFETTEEYKRAVRMRAGLDNLSAADVINAALRSYLNEEIAHIAKRVRDGGEPATAPRAKKELQAARQ